MPSIGILDADLVGRSKHRFPNLACMKISAYHKEKGNTVKLLTKWEDINNCDEVYISKVFTDTVIPEEFLHRSNIKYGGTGFYYDAAEPLPPEVEHHKPDYELYSEWVSSKTDKKEQYKYYTDYSIGFTTRGCFRKCEFCVNKKYNRVFKHSSLNEFVDNTKKKICLLDDNILGFKDWSKVFDDLEQTGKKFQFKQGLDERLLDDAKCSRLFNSKYDGDFIFAFDDVKDYDLIESKLKIIDRYRTKGTIKFYVLVGFKSVDADDIEGAFKRIELLFKYKCIPYVMRYQSTDSKPYQSSKYSGMYYQLARWSNQPKFIKTTSFREFCYIRQTNPKRDCAAVAALKLFEHDYPGIAAKYFDLRF